MNHAIVVGALGFVGFNLCNALLNEGYKVTAFNDNRCISPDWFDDKMLEIGRNANLDLRENSINLNQGKNTLSNDVGIVYYIPTINEDNSEDPHIRKMEMDQLEVYLNYCLKYNIPLVYLSSLKVYGELDKSITEDDTCKPTTPLGKLYEHFESKILSHRDLNAYIFRVPIIYGPWQPKRMTFYKMLSDKETIDKESVDNHLEEENSDVVFVGDVIDFLKETIQNPPSGTEIIHITSGNSNQLIAALRILTDKNKQTTVNVQFTNQKAYEKFGMKPTTSLEEGLNQQRSWIKQIEKSNDIIKDIFSEEDE